MKRFEIGFRKSYWQYIEVTAESADDAIKKARESLSTSDWTDFGNQPEVADVSEL